MMLRHLGLLDHANRISNAVYLTIQNTQSRTRDMGGELSTTDFTKAIISSL
jgi:isocitrate dehydrogenase (NAD+)